MYAIYLTLLIASAAAFFLALIEAHTGSPGRVNWIALGLLCYVLVPLIQLAKS